MNYKEFTELRKKLKLHVAVGVQAKKDLNKLPFRKHRDKLNKLIRRGERAEHLLRTNFSGGMTAR